MATNAGLYIGKAVELWGAAKDSHRLLTAITESSTDPIFAKDTEHRYLIINSFAAKALNTTPDKLIGKSDWEVLPPDLAPKIVATDRRVMETGEMKTREEHVAAPRRSGKSNSSGRKN